MSEILFFKEQKYKSTFTTSLFGRSFEIQYEITTSSNSHNLKVVKLYLPKLELEPSLYQKLKIKDTYFKLDKPIPKELRPSQVRYFHTSIIFNNKEGVGLVEVTSDGFITWNRASIETDTRENVNNKLFGFKNHTLSYKE